MRFNKHVAAIVMLFILAICVGAGIYHSIEGWSWIDSFYFVVITVTTIGYGDLAPTTNVSKIFTMFFAFFGVAMALYLLSKMSSTFFKKHVNAQVKEIKKDVKKEEEVEKKIEGVIKNNMKKPRTKRKVVRKKAKKRR